MPYLQRLEIDKQNVCDRLINYHIKMIKLLNKEDGHYISSLSFSSNDELFASSSADKTIVLYQIQKL